MKQTRIRLSWRQKVAELGEYKRRSEAGHQFTRSDEAVWAKQKFSLPSNCTMHNLPLRTILLVIIP